VFHRHRALALIAITALSACAGGDPSPASPDATPPVADADPGTPQRPPRGQAALEAWLAEGFYGAWRCEDRVSSMRLSGSHGRHKICSNDLLLASTSGVYPVGAASVKELYVSGDQPNGFAVGLKVEAGEGAHTWYWYERRGTNPTAKPLAQGIAVPDCAVCHGTAGRDYVFFRAP